MLRWEFVTNNALKSMKMMKTLYNKKKKSPGHRSSSSQQTSATLTSSLCTCSRRFLDYSGGTFLVQLLERPIREREDFSLPELLLNNSKVVVRSLIREDTVSCSNHDMITVRTERIGGKISIRGRTHNFRRANSILYMELLGRISWKTAIKGKMSRTAIWFLKKISWEFRNKASYCIEDQKFFHRLRLAKQGVS